MQSSVGSDYVASGLMRSSLGEARNVGFVEEDTLHTPILRYELGNAKLLQMLTPIKTGTDRIGVWSQHQVEQSQPCSHEATVVAAGSLEWSHRATDAVGRVTCPPAAARNDFWVARNGIDNFETGNMFTTAAQDTSVCLMSLGDTEAQTRSNLRLAASSMSTPSHTRFHEDTYMRPATPTPQLWRNHEAYWTPHSCTWQGTWP